MSIERKDARTQRGLKCTHGNDLLCSFLFSRHVYNIAFGGGTHIFMSKVEMMLQDCSGQMTCKCSHVNTRHH